MLRAIRYSLTALGLLVVIVTVTPLVPWWARALAGPWNDPTGEVLVVLGAALEDKGILGVSSYWRSVYATLTWREGGFRRMIVTGGGSRREGAVAPPMREFIAAMGVPAQAIEVESVSNSTRENALLTRPLLQGVPPERVVLLTSDFHMFRAHRVFRKAGLNVQPRPFPDIRKRSGCRACRWTLLVELVEETTKIGYYWARGWI